VQDRFRHRVDLAPSDIREVVTRRVLSKKERALPQLHALYQQTQASLPQVSDTEEKPFSGLGIGLYISSQIIKQHQGRIWVESTKRAGATFYFTLPLKDPKVALLTS
jgi:signal transduction histidine kinase